MLVKLNHKRRADREVVQVGEDRLLGDALHARQAREGEGRAAVLERAREPALEEVDHLAVVAVGVAGHDGGVVLVHQQNRRPAMVAVQHGAQAREGVHELPGGRLHRGDALEVGTVVLGERGAFAQAIVADVLLGHRAAHGGERRRPVELLHRVEADVDDGKGALVRTVLAALGLPHTRSLEQRRRVGHGDVGTRQLEECLEHRHVEGLAEAARSAEEGHRVARLDDVGDEHGLVDDDRLAHGGNVAVAADGEALVARAVDDARVGRVPHAVAKRREARRGVRLDLLTHGMRPI